MVIISQLLDEPFDLDEIIHYSFTLFLPVMTPQWLFAKTNKASMLLDNAPEEGPYPNLAIHIQDGMAL
jgi:hypothetical protein